MMNVFGSETVLITGASSGIGEAFAHSLAQRGAKLILAARSENKLSAVAAELREKYGANVHVFPIDLTLPGAPLQLYQRITDSGLSVDVLINNAGFGKWANFLGEGLDTYKGMLSLNINALLGLAYLCLPGMLERGRGGVINVASTAAFQPIPYQAVYAASKSFVLSLTEALAEEYRGGSIRFMALCPGNTDTNFMVTANADTEGMSFATPQEVAEAGIAAFMNGKSCHVHGRVNYLTSLLPRVLPRSIVTRVVAGMFRDRVTA